MERGASTMPLSLSDSELAAVMAAAAPIPRDARDEFLRAVASELEKFEVLGVGVIGRVCSRLQREHMNPPRYRNGVTKWR
jgi:hypothetical protein